MKKNGFTLIELIAVILIISIIIGIALPRFSGIQDQALVTKAQGELRSIQTAVESYYMHETPYTYPDTTSNIIADYLINSTPQIMSHVILDPFHAGAEYNYIRSDSERYYVIFSYGLNGSQDIGGIDDNGKLTGSENDDIFATNGSGWQ